jgi:hypothetical protein
MTISLFYKLKYYSRSRFCDLSWFSVVWLSLKTECKYKTKGEPRHKKISEASFELRTLITTEDFSTKNKSCLNDPKFSEV